MTKPEPTAEEISYDDLSEQYADETNLDPNTYRGDVETAFVCGMMKADEINQSRLQAIAEEVEEMKHKEPAPFSAEAERNGVFKKVLQIITKHLDQ